jgi:hypothetical protein
MVEFPRVGEAAMTEAEWLACARPQTMLEFLGDRAGERKLRLFACACCRRLAPLLRSESARRALDLAERAADDPGAGVRKELARSPARVQALAAQAEAEEHLRAAAAAEQQARARRSDVWASIWAGAPTPDLLVRAAAEAEEALAVATEARAAEGAAGALLLALGESPDPLPAVLAAVEAQSGARQAAAARARSVRWLERAEQEAARPVPRARAAVRVSQAAQWIERAEETAGENYERLVARAQRAERKAQCALLRDLFVYPERPVRLDPAWLHWRDGTVVRVARSIDDDGRFGDLPVLADALEEAGCADADLLGHCRSGGPHVRGCWLVDLILSKAP